MALNTNLTTSTGLSDGAVTHYQKSLLAYAKPKLVHAQFAEKISMPRNSGKVVQFRRLVPLDTIITPLTEATQPDGQTLTEEAITATAYQYGGYAAGSDFLQLTHLDPFVVMATELMGDQGGRSVDEIVRNKMAETTNIQYANSKTAIYSLKTTDKMSTTEIRLAVRTLKTNKAMPFMRGGREHFVAIVDEYATYDMQSDTLWQDVSKYQDKENIYSGEIGRIFGVIFVETTEAKTYVNAELIDGQKYLTAASLSSATVTVDEAITAAEATALVGRYVNVVDATDATGATSERQKIVSAVAGAAGAATVTLDAAPSSFTLADGDVLYANEYGYNGNTVHATMIFGRQSYGMIDINGSKNMHIIIKNKNEGGPSNALELFSTVGWKVDAMATVILNEDWLLKLLHGATA